MQDRVKTSQQQTNYPQIHKQSRNINDSLVTGVFALKPQLILGARTALVTRTSSRIISSIGIERILLLLQIFDNEIRLQPLAVISNITDHIPREALSVFSTLVSEERTGSVVAVVTNSAKVINVVQRINAVRGVVVDNPCKGINELIVGVAAARLIDGADGINSSLPQLLHTLVACGLEATAVVVPIGDVHECNRDISVAQVIQGDDLVGDAEVALIPVVAHACHLGVGGQCTGLATGPVVRAVAGIAGSHEDGADFMLQVDVVDDLGVDEEEIVVLVGGEVEGTLSSSEGVR